MHRTLAVLSLLAATSVALPVSPASTEPTRTMPAALTNIQAKARSTKLDMAPNPYKFTFKSSSVLKPTLDASSKQLIAAGAPGTQLVKAQAASTNEKNWLLTKAWLIDNINRLRRELSELERDYSHHLNTVDQTNSQRDKQLQEDISKLRADHTVLSQQQKQIIYLIKKNQMFRSKPISLNDVHYGTTTIKSGSKVADAPARRQIKRDLSQSYGDTFEAETRRNLKEVFSEVSSLHDIALSLFDGLRSLEHRVENRDKLFK